MLKSYTFVQDLINKEQKRVLELNDRINSIYIANSTHNLLTIGNKILDIYSELKSYNNYLDYDDLIEKAIYLLNNYSYRDWIRYKLDLAIEHILIDESQDTNSYQWDIIKAVTEDFFAGDSAIDKNRTIFIVGDEKQSIYGFQGAEPKIFSNIYHYYNKIILDSKRVIKNINLSNSFRSLQAILKSVDLVFKNKKRQESISALEKEIKHYPIKSNYIGRVELWPIINIEENNKDEYDIWNPYHVEQEDNSKEILAQFIVSKIKEWIEKKRILKSKNRVIKYKDITILVKKRTSKLDSLITKFFNINNIPVSTNKKINLTNGHNS